MRVVSTILIVLLALAYIAGLFVPIMNHNAAHHANIALHMYLTGDYVSLVDRGQDYLDKPHLFFWLAALAYHLFGVTAFAYKFFTFVFVLVGIYSTYRLGALVFSRPTGVYAALMLSTAFAFILSAGDVKMDGMVVSCIAFATWQLFAYFFRHHRPALFFGALGLALGFATKGMVAIALPAMATVFYALQQKKVQALFPLRWLPVALITALLLVPLFYCFYLQFDLHPEKVIRGRSGNSGVWFLLLGQSVDRYTGRGWGSRDSDPFFLIHTFLWAFLPWSLMAYAALFRNIKGWFTKAPISEKALSATVLIVFVLISFSQFKNPHYVNILFPYFAILTAHFLRTVDRRHLRTWFWIQVGVGVLLIAGLTFVNTLFFPVTNVFIAAGATLLALCFVGLAVSKKIDMEAKTLWISVAAITFTYFLLNFSFYPKLLRYQSGQALAAMIKKAGIDPHRLYYLENSDQNYSMEFSLQTLVPAVRIDTLPKMRAPVYLFATPTELARLKDQGIAYDTTLLLSHYNVSTLKYRFLNPATRSSALTNHYIVRLKTQ